MGVAIEFLQGMTGYRTFEVADMIANAIGAALGFGAGSDPLGRALDWTERLLARREAAERRSGSSPSRGRCARLRARASGSAKHLGEMQAVGDLQREVHGGVEAALLVHADVVDVGAAFGDRRSQPWRARRAG